MDVLGILAVLAFVVMVAFMMGGTKQQAIDIEKPKKQFQRDKNGRFAKKSK